MKRSVISFFQWLLCLAGIVAPMVGLALLAEALAGIADGMLETQLECIANVITAGFLVVLAAFVAYEIGTLAWEIKEAVFG